MSGSAKTSTFDPNRTKKWNSISCGQSYTFALDSNNDLYVWGMCNGAQHGIEADSSFVYNIHAFARTIKHYDFNLRTIGMGGNRVFAINRKRKLYGYGDNTNYALGDGTNINRTSSKLISSAPIWNKVDTGIDYSFGLSVYGQLYGWSTALSGYGSPTTPTPIETNKIFSQISTRLSSAFALDNTGKIYSLGNNSYGQLGLGSTSNTGIFTQVGSGSNWVKVSTGGEHSCAINNSGALYCWGRNNDGQLGINSTTNVSVPTFVGSGYKDVECGTYHTLAVTTGNQIHGWGNNFYGQLGYNNTADQLIPTGIGLTVKDDYSIGCGRYHSVVCKSALDRSNNNTVAFGNNFYGQLGNGSNININNINISPTLTECNIGYDSNNIYYSYIQKVFAADDSSAIIYDYLRGFNKLELNQTGAANERLGWSLALNDSGKVLAISSNVDTVGKVQIYNITANNTLSLIGSAISGTSAAWFGHGISINSIGEVIAIGAANESSFRGATRIYSYNGSSWVQRGATISGVNISDIDGWSVSLNNVGDVLAIGAPATAASGYARVFDWNGSTWNQRGSTIFGEVSGDNTGWSVSLNGTGDVVAIGSPSRDSGRPGYTKIYSWDGSSWSQLGSKLVGNIANDRSGISVHLNDTGNILAVGAPFDNINGTNSGSCTVYYWTGSSWVKRGITIYGDSINAAAGIVLKLNNNGDILAVSSSSSLGKLSIYHWNGISWVQRAANINYTNYGNLFIAGGSIAMNGSGDIVAIGNDSANSNAGQIGVLSVNPT